MDKQFETIDDYMCAMGMLIQDRLPKIDCSTVMFTPAYLAATHDVRHSLYSYFVTVIKMLFSRRIVYNFEKKDNSRILFFFGGLEYTEAHFRAFHTLTEKIERADRIIPIIRNRKLASPMRVLKRIIFFFLSLINKPKSGLNNLLFYYSMVWAIAIYDVYLDYRKRDFSIYRLVTAYSELSPEAVVILQLCKHQGVETATLQHGMFQPELIANKLYIPALYYSYVDYFLAWNELTRQSLLEEGIKPCKIIVLGILRFENAPHFNSKATGRFGVILSISDDEDPALIKIANEYARISGMQFIVRYHPQQREGQYNSIVDNSYFAGNCSCKDNTLMDFAESVEFSLVGQSTVFTELVRWNCPAYHYVGEGKPNIYSFISAGSFRTPEDIVVCRKNARIVQEELFQKLCSESKSIENYKHFFAKFNYVIY